MVIQKMIPDSISYIRNLHTSLRIIPWGTMEYQT